LIVGAREGVGAPTDSLFLLSTRPPELLFEGWPGIIVTMEVTSAHHKYGSMYAPIVADWFKAAIAAWQDTSAVAKVPRADRLSRKVALAQYIPDLHGCARWT
jgi:hypothetical protein